MQEWLWSLTELKFLVPFGFGFVMYSLAYLWGHTNGEIRGYAKCAKDIEEFLDNYYLCPKEIKDEKTN